MSAELTGTAILMAMSDDKMFERFVCQCAGDAMLEYGEIDPEQHRYAAREIARIAARLASTRTAERIVDARRALDSAKNMGLI